MAAAGCTNAPIAGFLDTVAPSSARPAAIGPPPGPPPGGFLPPPGVVPSSKPPAEPAEGSERPVSGRTEPKTRLGPPAVTASTASDTRPPILTPPDPPPADGDWRPRR